MWGYAAKAKELSSEALDLLFKTLSAESLHTNPWLELFHQKWLLLEFSLQSAQL